MRKLCLIRSLLETECSYLCFGKQKEKKGKKGGEGRQVNSIKNWQSLQRGDNIDLGSGGILKSKKEGVVGRENMKRGAETQSAQGGQREAH